MAEQVGAEAVVASSDGRKAWKMKDATRPQDWAPSARVYLFGMHTLSQEERAHELTRMSGGRRMYRER